MKISIGGIISAGIRLVNHRVELERIKELLEPAIDHLVRVWPELWAVTRNLLIELGVMKEGESEAYLAGFTPRWLQEGLKRTVAPRPAGRRVPGEENGGGRQGVPGQAWPEHGRTAEDQNLHQAVA
ncbi:MAG: hypothetical protein WBW73_29995 [Rhodoplanes sp.]